YQSRSEVTPTDPEWDVYLEDIAGIAKRHKGVVRSLVFTEGGPPTPVQRKKLGALSKTMIARSAVITSSVIARTVVTAIAWFGFDIRSFSPTNVEQAYAFLDVTPEEALWLKATRERLVSELRGSS